MSLRAVAFGIAVSLGFLCTHRSSAAQGLTSSTQKRPDSPVDGIAVDSGGRPLAGVQISGMLLRRNEQPPKVETDASGRFHLDHPGPVLHFYREDLRPRTLVLPSDNSTIRVVLEAPTDDLVALPCEKATQRGEKLTGVMTRYAVSDSSVRLRRGTIDVDYVVHAIVSKKNKSVLEIWFGAMAMSGVPDDDTFLNSSTFAQRAVRTPGGEMVGLDYWGTLKSGRRWRRTSIGTEGVVYRDAAPADIDAFDRIINSGCTLRF